MTWKPIETAPKDETFVLLYAEAWEMTWGIQIGSFREGKWHTPEGSVAEDETETPFGDDGEAFPIGPTHWMPLPEPPP